VNKKEFTIQATLAAIAFIAIVIVFLIIVFLIREAFPLYEHVSLVEFFSGTIWLPNSEPERSGLSRS
jgi:ABC-type phosphate transport system permease subunit